MPSGKPTAITSTPSSTSAGRTTRSARAASRRSSRRLSAGTANVARITGHEQQVDARVGLEGALHARVAAADVARPEAQAAQRLADARRRPDRPRLLGEGQEVLRVAHVHRDGREPPQRRRQPDRGRAQQEAPDRAPGDVPDAALVDDQQRRAEQHPRGDRDVDAAAGRREDQREAGRPPPAARVAHAAVDAQQQPRQRRVGEQRDARAAGVRDDVRVERVQQRRPRAWATPRGRPVSASSSRTIPHAASASQRPEPQPPDDPGRDPERVAEREERRHRPQVAAVLPGPDVPEARSTASTR